MNFKGVDIDIDRAIFLMDKEIWWSLCGEMAEKGEKDPQIYWHAYCERHERKHGAPFGPEVRDSPL
jgi:hypothetical protein